MSVKLVVQLGMFALTVTVMLAYGFIYMLALEKYLGILGLNDMIIIEYYCFGLEMVKI